MKQVNKNSILRQFKSFLNVSSVFDQEWHGCDIMLQEINILVLLSIQDVH